MNASNITQGYFLDCPVDSDIVRTVKVMSVILVAGFGVFGNVLVILIAVKYTRQSNIHHLIVNMAVADTLVILLYSMQNVFVLTNEHIWSTIPNFGSAWNFCKFIKLLELTSKTLTLLTLVIISIERYRATRATALRLRPYTKRQRAAVVTCSWVLSMSCISINSFVIELNSKNGIYFCKYLVHTTTYKVASISGSTTSILSFCITLLLSTLTSLRLRRPSVVQANLSDVQRKLRAKRITNAVRMVVCSVLVYFFCYSTSFFWLAFFFEMSFSGYSHAMFGLGCKLRIVSFISSFLMFLNSCVSPYICIIFLSEFRETTKRLLFSKQRPAAGTALELGAGIENQGMNDQDQPRPVMQRHGETL